MDQVERVHNVKPPSRAVAQEIADAIELPPSGHFYEFDVDDDAIAKMLDWDKPLSEHPKAAQSAVTEALDDAVYLGGFRDFYNSAADLARSEPGPWGTPEFGSIDDLGAATGRQLVELMNFMLPGKRGADRLREAGIPGIKYLDQGSRAQGDGTRNYVIFDPEITKLKARDDVRFSR